MLEGTVSRMQQDLDNLQTENRFFADETGNRTRASGATGSTDDDEGSLV